MYWLYLRGDISGAIDASLKAISLATSDEETESLTSYLESLMETLSQKDNAAKFVANDMALTSLESTARDTSTFATNKDYALSELEMKLEIEKLRYRLLEQEHAIEVGWGRRRSDISSDYATCAGAIDYQRDSKESHINYEKQSFNAEEVADGIDDNDDGSISDSDLAAATTLTGVQANVDEAAHTPIGATHDANSATASDDEQGKSSTEVIDLSEVESTPDSDDESTDNDDSSRSGLKGTTTSDLDDAPNNLLQNQTDLDDSADTVAAEPIVVQEPIVLPELYNPLLVSPTEVPATSKSYMKMADAYLDKAQYALAAKQFVKVIKKAPDHLPAHLGYATALERAGKSKQINDAALAYGNATKVAIAQGDKVDALGKVGTGGMGEHILRRAIKIAQSAPSGRLETLQKLSSYAHTAALAADIYFAIGMEIVKLGIDKQDNKADAVHAFSIANEFVASRNDAEVPFHVASLIELGKLALESDDNAKQAIEYFEKAKQLHLEDDDHVKMLVLSGQAHSVSIRASYST